MWLLLELLGIDALAALMLLALFGGLGLAGGHAREMKVMPRWRDQHATSYRRWRQDSTHVRNE